jgi:hypothetical protein
MTRAICIRCGTEKVGALTPCAGCGFDPESLEDRARSVVLSDHHLSPADMESAAAEIRAGSTPDLPEDLVAGYLESLKNPPSTKGAGIFIIWFMLGALASLGVMFAIGAACLAGEWLRALYRLGGLLAMWGILLWGMYVIFLWEGGPPPQRDARFPLKWKVILGAPLAVALVVALAQGFRYGFF